MKKIFTKEFGIGLSVIIAIVILFVGIDYLKGINLFQPANFYIVEYDNVLGLEKSAPVKLNGLKVGQVRDIRLDMEHPVKVKVTLALNRDLRLPADTKAELGSTLLSGAYVGLIMGHSDKILEVGSTLESYVTPDLMESVAGVMPEVTEMTERIDSVLSNLNRIVADPALLQSIQRLDGITNHVLFATEGLDREVNGSLPGIMSNARAAVINIDTVARNLAYLSRDLKSLPLQPTLANVQRVTENLEVFSRKLNDQNSTLGKLTNDPELYNRINTVAADVDSLIVDIKKNPKRYISIKLL